MSHHKDRAFYVPKTDLDTKAPINGVRQNGFDDDGIHNCCIQFERGQQARKNWYRTTEPELWYIRCPLGIDLTIYYPNASEVIGFFPSGVDWIQLNSEGL